MFGDSMNGLLASNNSNKQNSLLENIDLFGSSVASDYSQSSSMTSSQQSVPLYRRQAGQHYSASSSNAQSIASSTPDHLLDSVDGKLHPSAHLYGHNAFSNDQGTLQNIAVGLLQHQQQQQIHSQHQTHSSVSKHIQN